MLFFVKVRVKHEGMSLDELWDLWEEEAKSALDAKTAGKVKGLYKVTGQRRVLAIADVDSHDELDRILMAGVPMANVLEVEEILPIREYEHFAEDVKRRWK